MNAIHGKPLISPPEGATIHTTTVADTCVYLFAYSISAVEDVLRVYTQSSGYKTLLTSYVLSAHSQPSLVLNGYILSRGSALIVESGNSVVCTGWVSDDTTNIKPTEDMNCSKLNYKIQTLVPSRDEIIIDPAVPVTVIYPAASNTNLVLPDSDSGCFKIIILKCTHPVICKVRVRSYSFPEGTDKSTGILKFVNNGDSAQLLWTGSEWMLANSGCQVT